MNKKILLALFALLVLVSSVVAIIPMPRLVYGTVTIGGEIASGTVTVTDLMTDVSYSVPLDENGFYVFDVGLFNNYYLRNVRVKACEGAPKCEIVFEVGTESQFIKNFDFLPSETVSGLVLKEVIVEKVVVVEKEVVIIKEVPVKYEWLLGLELSDTQLDWLLNSSLLGTIGVLALAGYYWRKGQKVRAAKMVRTHLRKRNIR